ncbi:MAG: glycosyltransferase [Candidatus Omnitrophota bacterium]
MKLLFVSTGYEMGGVSTVARNLIESFSSDGFELVLVTEKLSGGHCALNNGVRLIDLNITPKKGFARKAANLFRHLANMRDKVDLERPDAIISFGSQANCVLLLSLLGSVRRYKVIITEHSEEMFLRRAGRGIRYAVSRMAYRFLMFLLYRRADYVVAVSGGIAAKIKKSFMAPSRKIKVIHNPVDLARADALRGRRGLLPVFKNGLPRVGTVSRLSPEKGIDFLIDAFSGLSKKMDARLVIAGDGPERLRLEKMAIESGVRDKVLFTGWAEDPFSCLAGMDIFVLPSLWEGFPNVILEAMACGVPVIASDCSGGIREVIKNGVNGVLVKPASPPALTEAMRALLDDPVKRSGIIEEAAKTVRRFDKEVIKAEYGRLILS